MVHELISNIALIVTFTFLSGQIHSKLVTPATPFKYKTIIGVLSGFYGTVLMLFSVSVSPTIILDLRHLFVISAAIFGGTYSALIAALIISIGRVLISGGFNIPALVNIICVVTTAVICGAISRHVGDSKKKWIYMTLVSITIFSIAFAMLIQDSKTLLLLYSAYWSATLIATLIFAFLISYLRKYNELFKQMESQAKTDFLTGLNNVREFDAVYNTYISEVQQKNKGLSLLLIDIDFFKKINDTYGHSCGDAVLKQFGEILIRTSRRFDVVSRNGGEEFSVILPDTSLTRASQVAERIRKAVQDEEFLLPDGKRVLITVSIGLSCYSATVATPEDLFEQADQALYKAKQAGRNRVCSIPQ